MDWFADLINAMNETSWFDGDNSGAISMAYRWIKKDRIMLKIYLIMVLAILGGVDGN